MVTSSEPRSPIAESAANDPRTIRTVDVGGQGFDAQWSDDFHHALHALLTGERDGYYEDFGAVADNVDAPACERKGVATRTLRRRTNIAMGEHTMMLVLALAYVGLEHSVLRRDAMPVAATKWFRKFFVAP